MASVAAASSCSESAFLKGFMDLKAFLKGDGLKQVVLPPTRTLLKVSGALACQGDVVVAHQGFLHVVISPLHLPREHTK